MMKLGKSITTVLARPTLKLRKYSPEILVIGGVVGVVATVAMVVRAAHSEKCRDICDAHEADIFQINRAKELTREDPMVVDPETGKEVERYSDADVKADTLYAHKKMAIGLTKVYWPSATMLAVSVVMILSGFRIIRKRNMALVAAYNIVDQAFKGYRERVKAELGEEMDTHFMHDTEMKAVTKTVKNEDGTTTKIKETEQILKGNVVSMYGRLYDETSKQFEKDPRFNWLYLKKKRDYFNDRLHSRGHVFLNEVYEELGFEHTSYGAVVGWVSKKDGGEGDNYISFGPWCEKLSDVEENGYNQSIPLDFNVDGVIYDMI